jgi:iron complex outermembrane receptor protein
LFGLELEELARLEVSIATGTLKPLASAPAVASVITAAELEALGVQDIDEALEMVPGLHVSHGSFIYASRYFIRGITSTYNPHTLVLVNGIPQTSLFTGDRGQRMMARSGLPVKMIERIEIIRGPGSAVYGADAFAGVLNIITKRPEDLDGGQASLAYGSFDTWYGFLRQSVGGDAVQGVVSLAYDRSEGDDPLIEADQQTSLDAQFGSSASLAPGPANLGYRNLDVRSDLRWDDWRLRLSWRQDRVETAQGINDVLDPDSYFSHHHGTADLTWQAPEFRPDWDLEAQLSYLYSDFRNPTLFRQFPPGAFGGSFPEGMLQKPELAEENARLHLVALYRGWDAHRLRLGSGFYWGDIFETRDAVNFELVPGNPVPQPRPLTDVSDTARAFLPENQRTSSHVFVQDEWQLTPEWELTAGLRHDDYSDVGGTTNPRLSLVWQATPALTGKLLYGEAFRPPAFFELYARNNPVALGNPQLRPEKLKSLELALSWNPTPAWSWDINLYEFHIRDFIDFLPDPGGTFTAQNASRLKGRGVETELRHQLDKQLQVLANFSHQQTRDEGNGEALGFTPGAEANLRLIWEPAPHWQVTPRLVWVGPGKRPAGDARADLDGYTTLDLSLRRHLPRDFTLSFTARNLFDAEVREASRGPEAGQPVPSIPNDLPQAGRSVTLEVDARW